MPRLFGLNLVGVLAASFAFFFVGFVIYGALFSEMWMQLHNVTAEQAEAAGMSWLAPALVITILQVVGLGVVLKWRGVEDIKGAVLTAGALWLVFAVPLMSYDPIYIPQEKVMSLMIDGLHLLIGWVVSAVILVLLK